MPDEKVYNENVRDLPPATLFKYRTCDAPTFKRDRDIIVGNALWAGSPLAFNDPFDCVPVIDLTGSAIERKAYAARQTARRGIGVLPRQQRRHENRRVAKMIEQRWNKLLTPREAQEHWKGLIAQTGVLCFADSPIDMAMWGYYSDGHRGYCLEFDTSAQPFILANRVLYDDERPRFRVLDQNREDLMERLLLRKAKVWEHEHEWRMVQSGKTGPWTFPPELLKSVTFGANMLPQHEDALRSLVAKHQGKVALKRTVLDGDSFKLRVVDA